jgi:carbonic anhydrase
MSEINALVQANARYRAGPPLPSASPTRRLAVVTCMDARLDLPAAFGLQPGQAHVLRNAGGLPTPDVLRSLAISQRALGTREIAIIHHSRCGMSGFDDPAFRAQLEGETGAAPEWDVPGFTDLEAAARHSVAVLRGCPWLPHRDAIRGFVLDIDTQRLVEVEG